MTNSHTPRLTNENQIVKVSPDKVEVGYLLHDGLVTDIEVRHDVWTGKPVEYVFETPHSLIVAGPDEEIFVYTRVVPEIALAVKAAYEAHRASDNGRL